MCLLQVMQAVYFIVLSVLMELCPPHEMERQIVLASLSVCLSVCPSVRLSVRHAFVFALSFEPLVGFTNNIAKMSSMMR